MLLVKGNEVAVLEVWVVLDLVNDGWGLGRLEDSFEMLLEEVGDADGFGTARLFELLELSPSLLKVFVRLGEPWAVDQVQVDIVET